MQTENEIFTKYLKEKFNEVDLELNAPLRDTADFNGYLTFSVVLRKPTTLKVKYPF